MNQRYYKYVYLPGQDIVFPLCAQKADLDEDKVSFGMSHQVQMFAKWAVGTV
jgi:hypothetical protein